MRILFLTHAFNSLAQRLYSELSAELGADGHRHQLSIEFDIADSVAEEAAALFNPDLVVAPYLRRAIPESLWSRYLCLVVHPGIVGDRGPSALDRAITCGETTWGVTVLQANALMDGGDVWASENFAMRRASKGSLYRSEVSDAACRAVRAAIVKFPAWQRGEWRPQPLAEVLAGPEAANCGREWPLLKQAERAIDWQQDGSETVLARINAADGFPGVVDRMFGVDCHLFDACAEATPPPELIAKARPGDVIARRESALLRATVDGAVWIGHVKRGGSAHPFKLPATLALADCLAGIPELPLAGWWKAPHATWQDIAYEEDDGVGYLAFDFYNGAMSSAQCARLHAAYCWATTRPTRVIVLLGGSDFWSNGIHLNTIEAAESPSDESWRNINAIDDLALAVINTGSQLTVAALNGNCGAGGCFLARAADLVWARDGVILNPHYKNMGNLFGSEYWTYLLPPRVGEDGARALMQDRLPLSARRAVDIGFIDACLGTPRDEFRGEIARRAADLAAAPDLGDRLAAKRARRAADEAQKPLAQYRAEELAVMRRNFYGFDPSYHVARYHFVLKSPASWTPRHLARHRELGWVAPA